MADDSNKSDVFKFVALRPPIPIDQKNRETHFIIDTRQPEQTPVAKLIKTLDPKDSSTIPVQVKEFVNRRNYTLDYPENEGMTTLSQIYELAKSLVKETYTFDKLKDRISETLNSEISQYLAKDETQTILHNLWDRYYAFLILSRTESLSLDNLTKNLRVFHLLTSIVTLKTFEFDTLIDIISAKPIVSKQFVDLPKNIARVQQPKEEAHNLETARSYKTLWAQLIDVTRAIDELKNIKYDTKSTSETKDVSIPNRETGIEVKSKLTSVKNSLNIAPRSVENLHPNTKGLLDEFNFGNANFQIVEPITRMQTRLESLYRTASNIKDPTFLDLMPLEAKSNAGMAVIARKFDTGPASPVPLFPPSNIRALIKPLGIGDLKVVKQTLKQYVAGEVAHIENVLRGEYKERKHRVLDRSEDVFAVTNETEEETTKDTQTTDRFELKKESEKTIQEQMSVEAGVTASGSYGMVTFGAHGDFAYNTAVTESSKSSSNFAREVIDKSVTRIQKKTKEERTTKKLHEVEEINTHGLDNKGQPDHAVGIYRWIDKYYEAQIYNYGKRMMFEFIIPEPAAFYEYAQTHKPKTKLVPPPPLPSDITHRSITVDNYQDFIRDYNVQGVVPPPLPYKTISTSIFKEAMPLDGNAHAVNIKDLVVPLGYVSKVGLWWDCSAVWTHFPIIEITIGNKIFRPLEIPRNDGEFDIRFAMGNNHDRADIAFHWFWPECPIQISVNTYDVVSYTLNVYALVERTWEAMEQWQIQTFEKIMAAYKAMQIEYEQKVAAQETMQGIAIQGQNPRINREIEKTELKKQCIKLLMDTYQFGSFDAMKDDGINPPDFDIFDAFDEGKTIQFFEQAFEWENLTYLFYSYFWARKDRWIAKSSIYDTDPLFTKFLQAGSARVVLPVHPAYNDAVMYFLENKGAIWKGGEPPHLNDPLFISLADELRNRTDDLANAIPEGSAWEVVLPTTLVYLQKDAELPTF